MGRRILAWILLAGFVLLLVNLIFIHYQLTISILAYILIALIFLFGIRKK